VRKTESPWVMDFIRELCPDASDLYLASFNEETCLHDATELIRNLRAQLREVEERANKAERMYDVRIKRTVEMEQRAESAEAALKKAEERADRNRLAVKDLIDGNPEYKQAFENAVAGLNRDMEAGLVKAIEQRDAALALAERYREALVKAEAFLDENDYRLPMSGREAAALATIRIALQQGKGEGE
jgi:hypothetical protein